MLLTIDLGNTNIVFGGFEEKELIFQFRLKTETGRTVDEYSAILLTLLAQQSAIKRSFSKAIVCSVVPPLTPVVIELVRRIGKVEPLVVGPGIKTGLLINLAEPASVGSDRVVNAVAAKELFGCPALVVDFGTATSFDYISAKGAYEGGAIAPGALGALDSLVRSTAKLPRIELNWPKSVIGKSTVAAMQVGTVIGYSNLVDGLIKDIQAEVGPIAHIVATGGLGEMFATHSHIIKAYDEHLTLKGMRIIADMN